jgi:hypothetical protein
MEYESLSGTEVTDRFSEYELPDEYDAIYQPQGGFLDCEQCIAAHVEATFDHGGVFRHANECSHGSHRVRGCTLKRTAESTQLTSW